MDLLLQELLRRWRVDADPDTAQQIAAWVSRCDTDEGDGYRDASDTELDLVLSLAAKEKLRRCQAKLEDDQVLSFPEWRGYAETTMQLSGEVPNYVYGEWRGMYQRYCRKKLKEHVMGWLGN